jgi:hypothetical protein
VVALCRCDYAWLITLADRRIVLDVSISWDESGFCYTGPPLWSYAPWIQAYHEALSPLVYGAARRIYRPKRVRADQALTALDALHQDLRAEVVHSLNYLALADASFA